MNDIKVAVAQMNSGDDYSKNLIATLKLIQQASLQQCRILLLPENFICFSAQHSLNIAQHCASDILNALMKSAKFHNINLILGSFPILEHNDVFTQSIVIDDQGKIIARYNKIHLFKAHVQDGQGHYDESKFYNAGDSIINCDISGANFGLSICYDLRFPELYQQLRRKGAEIITVPAAFTYTTGKAHWLPLLQARAIETQCYVLASNQCGWHSETRQTWGHSCIISPWGEVLSSAESEPDLLCFNLEGSSLEEARQAIPVWQNKRL